MSIEVTDALVARIATLARLALPAEESEAIQDHFRKVLKFVEKLGELDLSQVDPSLFSLDASNIHREDEVKASLSVEDAIAAAPASHPPYFLVPRIVADAADAPEPEMMP
jgi:aspartyl-tRNA(Asn)/glutamyl-tRNA(Gln) amidotransferase subunit C